LCAAYREAAEDERRGEQADCEQPQDIDLAGIAAHPFGVQVRCELLGFCARGR